MAHRAEKEAHRAEKMAHRAEKVAHRAKKHMTDVSVFLDSGAKRFCPSTPEGSATHYSTTV